MPRQPAAGATPITSHTHVNAERLNIPEATEAKAKVSRDKKPTYRYSPHLSPKLQFDLSGSWNKVTGLIEKAIAGEKLTVEEADILRAATHQGSQPWLEWAAKQEQEGKGSFNVDDVILHVHERVSAKAILAAAQRTEESQDLFARPKLHRERALQYYKHNVDWANRLILGDSLQVMSSLSARENLAGKVQMIFMDPPYGINFRSNFQNEIHDKSVSDRDEGLTREPEMIRAYRDTWRLGVHSYLAYIKARLIVAKQLLKDGADGSGAGSIFVQISDENLHRVRAVMDEVFGPENFCSLISFSKNSGFGANLLPASNDYIIWFARDKSKVKYIQLYKSKTFDDGAAAYSKVMLADGAFRPARKEEKENPELLPFGARLFMSGDITKPGPGSRYTVTFRDNDYRPEPRWWGTTPEGMERAIKAGRVDAGGKNLGYIRYLSDFKAAPLSNVWPDTMGQNQFGGPKKYVVQTALKVIERCMLMSSEPGDLVLDPTCGSGTTALVAEQWGRRWITMDSSRVAISITRQRLLTACFDDFKVKNSNSGVDPSEPQNPEHGFHYETANRITFGAIVSNHALDCIFNKHEPQCAAALAGLNKALETIDNPSRLRDVMVKKLSTYVAENGYSSIYEADIRRWLLPNTDPSSIKAMRGGLTAKQVSELQSCIPSGEWKEWEAPFDTDPDWPTQLKTALQTYRAAWKSKQDEIDKCILDNAEKIELVDAPHVIPGVSRTSGPFTIEGVRPEEMALGEDGKVFDPTNNDADEGMHGNADGYIDLMVNLLRKDGVTFLGNRRAEFAALEKEAGKSYHAKGRWKGKEDGPDTVAVVFGPQYGPINAPLAVEAIESARSIKEMTDIVLAGFSFDAAAQEKAKQLDSPAFRVHLAHIRPDVSPGMQGLLKETPNSQLFTVFGQPEIQILPAGDGEYKVQMDGVCVYNPLTGAIEDTSSKKVAAWFLDTDYDGRCFCISQAFFPDKSAWEKIARALGGSIPDDTFEAFTTSWPFKLGQHKRIAVKVIDPRGNEVMAIKTISH